MVEFYYRIRDGAKRWIESHSLRHDHATWEAEAQVLGGHHSGPTLLPTTANLSTEPHTREDCAWVSELNTAMALDPA